jgi:hypothetical protein
LSNLDLNTGVTSEAITRSQLEWSVNPTRINRGDPLHLNRLGLIWFEPEIGQVSSQWFSLHQQAVARLCHFHKERKTPALLEEYCKYDDHMTME